MMEDSRRRRRYDSGEKIEARWESAPADNGKCPTDGGILKRLNPRSRKKTSPRIGHCFAGAGCGQAAFGIQ